MNQQCSKAPDLQSSGVTNFPTDPGFILYLALPVPRHVEAIEYAELDPTGVEPVTSAVLKQRSSQTELRARKAARGNPGSRIFHCNYYTYA